MSSRHDPTPQSETWLVARAIDGDTTAFEILARRHFRAAFAVALALAGNRADAEDICQDAFVSAHSKLAECRNPERFGAWLFQIVRNRAHSVREHQRVRRASPLEDIADTHAQSSPGVADPAVRADIRAGIQRAFRCLTSTQANVVLLHDMEGLKHREIALRLGISELMSRRHLFEARRVLREQLSDHDPGASA